MWVHGSNRALMRRTQAAAQADQAGLNLFHLDFSVCNQYANGLQAAALVRCPVTFVLGQSDQMTSPKVTRELATALKARVVMVEAGHHLMAEAPDAVLDAVWGAVR